MPALAWIAFWSLVMGAAACWCEQPRPVPVPSKKHRDRLTGGVAAVHVHHLSGAEI
jgi:hypothetical protein